MVSPGAANADPPYVLNAPGCICAREYPEFPSLEDAPLLVHGPSYLPSWLSSFISSAATPSKSLLRKPAIGMVLRYS